jgi:hypothetical protein
MDDTAKLVATVLLASFAIERITAAIGYVFDWLRLNRRHDEEAARLREERRRQLMLALIAAVLSGAVVAVVDLRILRVLGFKAPPLFDSFLTWLVLFAGADRIRDFLAGDDGGEKSETPVFRLHVHDDAEVRES